MASSNNIIPSIGENSYDPNYYITTSNDHSEIIHLNVGGTHYKISRSLIEQYPATVLAKMISKEWSSSDNNEIFIDRNGQRFRYVLDYMRDQKAHLAMDVSKDSILTELDYFGFGNVPLDSIDVGKASFESCSCNP
jgi:BTB/POZ domain